MDYKPHPEKFDFKRDIMCINRTTGRMLLSALTLITPQKRGQQIHDIINDAITLDWSDATHSLGFNQDKWAHKKAAEADVERRDTQWDFPSLILPGYIQTCPTVYGVNIGWIDCLDVWPTPFEDCTPEDICDEKSWSYREPVVLRAACQIMSELKHWEYFDKCSPLQCAKHLFANDFRPVDL